ncbi:MAG: class I SAM-dependent methyltransferase [Sphingobacteriia bacterium]|nr:class I SAM-dependent methyltransferase [Sphingobacteriia bacterium]
MSTFSDADKEKVVARYTQRFNDFGYSQKALGWGEKGRQEIRFEVLASLWDFKGASVLDIGAGFGDFFQFIGPDKIGYYHGFELVPALADTGKEKYGHHPNFELTLGDFINDTLTRKYDYVIISGLFNFKLVNGNNYDFIRQVISKAFENCNKGLASNFITDRVDYHEDLIFNTRPEEMVTLALSLTRNFVLRNDYFPFEFSLFLNKDDSFETSDTIFNAYKQQHTLRGE